MLMPLDPLCGWEVSSSAISFMAPQKCSARHLLPTEHCCSTWTRNKSRYKWLSEFHSRLNVFYLPARKVPHFCSHSILFGGISSVTPNVAAPESWILKIQVCRPLKSPQMLMSFSRGQPRALQKQQPLGEMFNILLPNLWGLQSCWWISFHVA